MDKEFAQIAKIAELNDKLRRSGEGGEVFITRGVEAEGPAFVGAALAAVCAFDEFTEANDPYLERDFGRVEIDGKTVLWKVDYYDRELRYHSPDPADPAVTRRVLTIMLAEEY